MPMLRQDWGLGEEVIKSFMWGFQGSFRRGVEIDLKTSLEALGVKSVEPAAFLIGVRRDGGCGDPLCIEPENGPIVPAHFEGLHHKANELYEQEPDKDIAFSNAPDWIRERKEQQFRGRAYGKAISEVLEEALGLRFFAGLPAPVNDYDVYTVVGLPAWILDDAPQLTSEMAAGRIRATRSLVQGVIDEILKLSTRELYQPYAGADLSDVDPVDVTKAAAESLIGSVAMLAGGVPSGLFDELNQLATTRYEGRVGIGSLLVAVPGSEYIDLSLALRDPVHLSETRAVRKLLEISSGDGDSLLTDGRAVYGLGQLRADYPEASESVFELRVTGDGKWELAHAGVALAQVDFGAPKLPRPQLERERFDDICSRIFADYDGEALWALADAAKAAEHGTILVISQRAADEAERLESQAIPTAPKKLDECFVPRVTSIDGALLVDPFGHCHGIGVILDGTAAAEGDRSRGARYNSAVKYLASQEGTPTVILLVSEDGMINLLPDMPRRIRRAKRDAMLADLRTAAEAHPVDGEHFYKAYRRIQENAFYFSQEQIDEINERLEGYWNRRIAQGGANAIRVIEPPLEHNEGMSDDYLMDD